MSTLQRVCRLGVVPVGWVVLAMASGGLLQPGVASAQTTPDVVAARASHIAVQLKVRPVDLDSLALHVSFFNPNRCDWRGHVFLEREDPSGVVRTLARGHDLMIPAGDRLTGTLVIVRPPPGETHLFVARAYRPDGGDKEEYFGMEDDTLSDDELPRDGEALEFVMGGEVFDAFFDRAEGNRPDRPGEAVPCDDAVGPSDGPVHVELSLEPKELDIDVKGVFRNMTRRHWRGDLYLDIASPDGGLTIVRRDLGVRIRPGVDFVTRDSVARPGPAGVHVFTARALRRDGSAEVRWLDAWATEITAVCNGEMCEPITPDQERADIFLRGRSAIHLVSDFSSEFTTVEMAYESMIFDITDLCDIRQWSAGGRYFVSVYFNSLDLPIGPRTWARYTIELHPMPPAPPGAKLSDSLWILTDGSE
jgi:hypothetical protein